MTVIVEHNYDRELLSSVGKGRTDRSDINAVSSLENLLLLMVTIYDHNDNILVTFRH
jgi:hypothetical protein